MTLRELSRFALGGLLRQKVRTILTLVAVAVGTCALAFSLALGLGMRAFIEHEFQSREEFWRIQVHVDEPPAEASDAPAEKVAINGAISEARKARLRQALVERYVATRNRKPPVPLTPAKLAAIAAMPDVSEVRTYRTADARVAAPGGTKPSLGLAVGGELADLKPRLLAGRLPEGNGTKEVVVSELVLYDLGWGDDQHLEGAIGRAVRLEVGGVRNTQPLALARALTGRLPGDELTASQAAALEKLTTTLPTKLDAFDLSAAERAELQRLLEMKRDDDERAWQAGVTASDEYRICGVVRLLTREDRKKVGPLDAWQTTQGDVFLAPTAGAELFGRLPWARDGIVYAADVRVRHGGDLQGTVTAIEAMGYRTFSALKWFASAKREVTLIAMVLSLYAFIALFVAAIGIAITLVTSVVERTREIGILRAVGATRAQVLGLILAEGAVLGLFGSAMGLALARGLAIPSDAWVRGILQTQADDVKLVSTSVFIFPAWLWAGSLAFGVLVTTLAAYYPAHRAARINPIEALRYG